MFEKHKEKKKQQKIERLRKELETLQPIIKEHEGCRDTWSPHPETIEIPPPSLPNINETIRKEIAYKKNTKKQQKNEQENTKQKNTPNNIPEFKDINPPLPDRSETYNPASKVKWTTKIKDKFWPERAILINMELDTGFHITFILHTIEKIFTYTKRTYYIDETLKYWHINAKMYCLDYHQSFSMPIKRVIDHTKIRQAIEASGMCEVESAVNPSNLESFIKSKVIEQLLKSQEITDFFKTIKFMIIIMLLLHAVNFILQLKNSGAMDSLKGMIP